MIQDIFPRKLYNQYDPKAAPAQGDFGLCFDGVKLLIKQDGEGRMCFPLVSDYEVDRQWTYLFSVDEERFFLTPFTESIPAGLTFTDVHTLRRQGGMPLHWIYAAMTGKHLADWYRDVRFCGRCGEKTNHSEKERAMVCPQCGKTFYPRIMPAVIVGVTNGDKLLITRYREGFRHNALIAGFTEIGETLEETVAREVMEEAGVCVKNIRYYKSQPWGVANDILVGFYCDLDGDPTIHMDDQELKYAQWVAREDIVLQPDNFSLTNEMMTMFQEGKE